MSDDESDSTFSWDEAWAQVATPRRGASVTRVKTRPGGFGRVMGTLRHFLKRAETRGFAVVYLLPTAAELAMLREHLKGIEAFRGKVAQEPAAGRVFLETFSALSCGKDRVWSACAGIRRTIWLLETGSGVVTAEMVAVGAKLVAQAAETIGADPWAAVSIVLPGNTDSALFDEATIKLHLGVDMESHVIVHDTSLRFQYSDDADMDNQKASRQGLRVVKERCRESEARAVIVCVVPHPMSAGWAERCGIPLHTLDAWDDEAHLRLAKLEEETGVCLLAVHPMVSFLTPIDGVTDVITMPIFEAALFNYNWGRPLNGHSPRTHQQTLSARALVYCDEDTTVKPRATLYYLLERGARHGLPDDSGNLAFSGDGLLVLLLLIGNFPGRDIRKLPVCFPPNWCFINEHLRHGQLAQLFKKESQPVSYVLTPRGERMFALMDMNQEFASLSLLGAATSEDVSEDTKRILIRLAAVVGIRPSELLTSEYQGAAAIPFEVLLDTTRGAARSMSSFGIIWTSVGLFERDQEGTIAESGGAVALQDGARREIARRVQKFEARLGLAPTARVTAEYIPSFSFIEEEILRAHLRNFARMRKAGRAPGEFAYDIVADRCIGQNTEETLIDWALLLWTTQYSGLYLIYTGLVHDSNGELVPEGITVITPKVALRLLWELAPDGQDGSKIDLSRLAKRCSNLEE